MPKNREKRLVEAIFDQITRGRLTVRDADGTERSFGTEGQLPSGRMIVRNSQLYGRILRNASLGMGEGYMDGDWDPDGCTVTDVIGVLLANDLDKKLKGNLGLALRYIVNRMLQNPSSFARSKKNVAHHYDLGNAFYQLFLDPTMTYSCGFQRTPQDSLEQMQRQKYALISKKLQLREGDRLLDIGCGWGGMLLHAAREHSVRGVGITLSTEQKALAEQRIREANLSDRIEIRLQDYRDVDGEFDKVVSIGMFEHVGRKFYRAFMETVARVLKPGGLTLLHTIGSSADPRIPSDVWAATYIFPGGRLPRLHEMTQEIDRVGCVAAHVENLKPHYMATLRKWCENFDRNLEKIRALGSPFNTERFQRMWRYYLQAGEACFAYSSVQLYQLLFHKGKGWPLPMVLDFHE